VREGSWHRYVAAASLASIASSGSTFVAFALAARALSQYSLAMVVGVGACAQIVQLIVDGGQGPRLIRDMSGPSGTALWFSAFERRSLIVTLLATAMAFAGHYAWGIPVSVALAGVVVAVTGVWYYLVLLAFQARSMIGRQVLAQSTNAVCTVVLAVAAFILEAGPAGFLFCLAGGYLLPSLPSLVRVAGQVGSVKSHPVDDRPSDARSWWISNIFTLGTNQADALIMGLGGVGLLANYALLQRPFQATSSLAFAVSSVAIPKMRTWATSDYRQLLRRLLPAALIGILLAPPCSVPLASLLGAIYDTSEVTPTVVAGFLVGAVCQLLHAVTGSALLNRHSGWGISTGSAVSATITCGGLFLVATTSHSLWHAGLVYGAARLGTLTVHWFALVRSLRKAADNLVD
jgi:hypothetical protein